MNWQLIIASVSIIGTVLSGFAVLIWKSSRWVARVEARVDIIEEKTDSISERIDSMWCSLSRMFPERFRKVADG